MCWTRSPSAKIRRGSGDDAADRAAVHRLAELERREIAFHVVHAAAHVGIDAEPLVAHAHLAVGEVGERELLQLEIS
jgi:hypothetical protein